MMKNKKIAIIGCGNLGESVLNGLISNANFTNSNITATRRNLAPLDHLKDTGIVLTSDNVKAIQESEIIILGLKPFNILPMLKDLKSHINADKHIVVSLATAISIEDIQANVNPGVSVFRAMPNTAADVGMSMTCICSNTDDKEKNLLIQQCFDAIGVSISIDEKLMDSATVLGACGIAYVLRFMRAMTEGGVQIGFDAQTACDIAKQTVKGAAELLIGNNQHPEVEIDKVTTPRGCTIAGLNEMEHNGLSSSVIKGIVTSFEQIKK
jgi:pyrroline-5-carboxylate reductase